MCTPEVCPLALVCEERLQFDTFVVNEQASEAKKTAANLDNFATQFQGNQTERAIEGIEFLRPALHARNQEREARERRSTELILQEQETDACPGMALQRRFRFMGKVTGIKCGNRAREARVNPPMPDREKLD